MIRMLDLADEMPEAIRIRHLTYELLALDHRTRAIDVGCGIGLAAAEMSRTASQTIALDPDNLMVQTASSRWPELDVRRGVAEHLPLSEGSVTAYRADKVFHMLADPGRAVAEAHRVLAPGGRIVLVGQDWDGVMIDAADAGLSRAVVQARADSIPSPRAARQYRSLLLDGGFDEVAIQGFLGALIHPSMVDIAIGFAQAAASTGAVTASEAQNFIRDQQQRAAQDRFSMGLPVWVAAATR
ncbi:methyltransferase domain-containing protein [Flexivirga sp. ID2601S]|uniref:Methyltransferase domain-containing protein n=1 Tax=Flexivirga aerilata TaxID=1656889 RepID=A0A849AVP2_9MICO|nr:MULTISPECIES: methyltransferase domain-containing protein [Flexivirga]NNG40732.1 methyltransferase domain-containing protein [Flexivirga aerilata]